MSFDSLLAVARSIAAEASELIMDGLDRPRNIDFKGRTDLVTDIDRESESLIKERIQTAFPEHAILAEETGRKTGSEDTEYLWVIDPLDGTTNYVHGYPSFAVSIGVLHRGKPVAGVVVEMPAKLTSYAQKGGGAFCDDQPIKVSRTSALSHALLVTGFAYEHGEKWQANMELFKTLTDKTQGVRRLGAAAVDICHVARGVVDGFWEFDLHPWDTAAGVVIAREAGATISRMDGSPFSIHDKQILVTNGKLHDPMLEHLSGVNHQPAEGI